MAILAAPDGVQLAGMIRTEIDQAQQAGDPWCVMEADLQAMYGVSPSVVTEALAALEAEGTVFRSGRCWVSAGD